MYAVGNKQALQAMQLLVEEFEVDTTAKAKSVLLQFEMQMRILQNAETNDKSAANLLSPA